VRGKKTQAKKKDERSKNAAKKNKKNDCLSSLTPAGGRRPVWGAATRGVHIRRVGVRAEQTEAGRGRAGVRGGRGARNWPNAKGGLCGTNRNNTRREKKNHRQGPGGAGGGTIGRKNLQGNKGHVRQR